MLRFCAPSAEGAGGQTALVQGQSAGHSKTLHSFDSPTKCRLATDVVFIEWLLFAWHGSKLAHIIHQLLFAASLNVLDSHCSHFTNENKEAQAYSNFSAFFYLID